MRISSQDHPPLHLGRSVAPIDKENNTKSISPSPSPPTTPPRPGFKFLDLHHRRRSSSSAVLTRSSSFYAGPQPKGPGGTPLKGCLKKSPSLSSTTTISSLSDAYDMSAMRRSNRKVSFSHVQLREYCRQVGDNPSVTSGCPLAIGWKFNKRGKVDIDTFEADRCDHRVDEPCLRLSSKQRETILSEIGGISHTQILNGQIQAHYDRQQRAETLEQIGGLKNCKSIGPRERLFIMRESAARKIYRAKKGISPSQEQEKLWEDAHENARRRSLSSDSTAQMKR